MIRRVCDMCGNEADHPLQSHSETFTIGRHPDAIALKLDFTRLDAGATEWVAADLCKRCQIKAVDRLLAETKEAL